MRTKKPVNLRLDIGLLERAKNCAFWIGRGVSLTSMIEDSLRMIVSSIEAAQNNGEPFPDRAGVLPHSRPKPGEKIHELDLGPEQSTAERLFEEIRPHAAGDVA